MPSPTPTLLPSATLPLRRPCKSFSLMCSKLITFKLLINFLFNFETCASLKLIMLEVPSPSYVGESVELSCIYELESDKLYSVKWYKNDVEFYRYVPKDWPPGQFLPINGIRVDLSKSGMNSVFLKYIDINTAGVYRCEVSAEAPSFVTAEGEKELQVTVLPLSGPQISGVQPFYKVGYQVNLNCTSAKSKPSAQIRWYLNNKEVTGDEYSLSNVTNVVHDDNLETSSRSLQFVALEKHFKSGTIRIKCTATVIRLHTMSNEAILRAETAAEKNIDYYLSETLSQPNNKGSDMPASLLLTSFIILLCPSLSLLSLMWTPLH